MQGREKRERTLFLEASSRAQDTLTDNGAIAPSAEATPAEKRVLSSLFPSFGVMVASLILAACDPGTSRPDVTPFPASQQIEVLLDRGPAITLLHDALVADSFPVTRFEPRDGWLEGPWVDARTRRPASSQRLGPGTVRLRAWAEPARPGNSYLIVELAWRAMADPSVPQRTLERPLAPTDTMSLWLKGLLAVVDSEVGFHEPAGTKH